MVKLTQTDIEKIEAELKKGGVREVAVKVENGKIVLLSVKKQKI